MTNSKMVDLLLADLRAAERGLVQAVQDALHAGWDTDAVIGLIERS
jgi:hypothetical protein